MRCNQYSTLGHYFNIMMPVKKSDFDKQVETFEAKCDDEQKKTCNKMGGKKCVIGVNNGAICEVGSTHEYHGNMLNKMK